MPLACAVITAAGAKNAVVQKTSEVGKNVKDFQVRTEALVKDATTDQQTPVVNAIESHFGVAKNEVSVNTIGSSWGQQITNKAIESLILFLLAIIVYLSLRYEWKMAAAAIIALVHDLIITTGIYALVGFDVSPSTVIGLLTILGYSLYDTVVVFDKVRENTREIAGGSRMTYSGAANLAVNQTLVRSINTSVIALLPVASLLFVGAGLLGAGSLKDLALALFIGLATGTYSSIFIATPLVALFKEREPQFISLAKRVAARQVSAARTPAAALAGGGSVAASGVPTTRPAATGVAANPAADGLDGTEDAPLADDSSGDAAGDSVGSAAFAGPARTPATRRPNTSPRRPGGRPAGKKRRR